MASSIACASQQGFISRPSSAFPRASMPSSHTNCRFQSSHTNCRFQRKAAILSHTSTLRVRPPRTNHRVRWAVFSVASSCLPDGATEMDAEYMRMCIQLAKKALGFTSPNPMVGCVIVKDGHIVGQGFHPKAGEPHAEVFALREAGENAKGSTAYVSLEPCNHYGRTPPCTHALIQARVNRVIVGMLDPNPIVAGKGIDTLVKAGIEVIVGVETPSCQALNEAYIHRMLEKKPFATLRFSVSLDGAFLGSHSVDCSAGSYFSKLLQENDAVIVSDTALLDIPALLSAESGSKQPLRIVLSNRFDLPLESSVFDTSLAPTLVIASEQAVVADLESNGRKGGQSMDFLLREKGVEVVTLQELDLDSILDVCYQRGFCSVLLDSRGQDLSGFGNTLGRQALEEKVLQKLIVDISPTLYGHTRAGPGFTIDKDMLPLERVSSKMSGHDVIIEGYFPK